MTAALCTALERRLLLLDGALGSELLTPARPAPACAEILNLEAPERVADLHRRYRAAGAAVLTTNTFCAQPHTLARFGLAERAAEINRQGVLLARAAADGTGFVLGSLGPGWELPSRGAIRADALEASYAVQARALLSAGVDGLLLETVCDAVGLAAGLRVLERERRAAGADVAILVSATIDRDGRLASGERVEDALGDLAAAGAPIDLVGLNCSLGPRGLRAPLERVAARSAGLPLGLWPNAGLPNPDGAGSSHPVGPEDFAREVVDLVRDPDLPDPGVRLAGGCCGAGPLHVRALAAALGMLPAGDPNGPAG